MAQLKSTSVTGNLSVTGNVVASQIIKLDGTNKHLLAADGSVYDLDNFASGIKFSGDGVTVGGHKYSIYANKYIRAPWLQHSSANLSHANYNKICITDDDGWIYYRTKTQFIQDLELSQVYNYKGTLTDLNALKSIASARVGDVYFISATSDSWACKQKVTAATGNDYTIYWSNLGQNVNLSGYMTLDTEQTITGTKTFNSIHTLNMNGDGPFTFPTTKNSGWENHYISAGRGYGTTAGRYGVKLVCCDQTDAQTGIGQDLSDRPGGYDTSIIGGTRAADGLSTISFVTHPVNSTTYTTLGYWTEGGHLYAKGNIYGNNLGSKDNIWSTVHAYSLNLHRGKSDTVGGRIYFYNGTGGNNNYTTWVEYMSNNSAKTCPTGGVPSTFGQVTGWARRSLIENNDTFGWIWESITGPSASGNPTAMMSLHANDGTLKVRGTVHAPSFGGANNDVYIRLSNSNEISFATAKGTVDSKNNKIYFGYANRLDSLVNDDNYNRVDTYVFGQHRGTSNNSCFRGHIECGTVSLNSTTFDVKATFEYNSSDHCVDVIFT